MGFVLIRHSAVELRRVNMDRVPKILCVLVRLSERWVRQVRKNLCLWSMSGAGWMTIVLGHKDVQSLSLPALEPRVFALMKMRSVCEVCVVTNCAHLCMLYFWVFC